jgi:hypothetical protein
VPNKKVARNRLGFNDLRVRLSEVSTVLCEFSVTYTFIPCGFPVSNSTFGIAFVGVNGTCDLRCCPG